LKALRRHMVEMDVQTAFEQACALPGRLQGQVRSIEVLAGSLAALGKQK
jgi:hypothetical protein